MSIEKVSPAFRPFMAAGRKGEKREAIVISQSSEDSSEATSTAVRIRAAIESTRGGRLHGLSERKRIDALKRRKAAVKEIAKVQEPMRASLEESYRKAIKAKRGEFSVSSIGEAGMPIMRTQVTRESLRALAESPGVVAVLPNQKVHLIKPHAVSYESLSRTEAKNGVTWGIKRLGIDKMWSTTQGKGVRVAVLDTGVHAAHPALKGRVKEFVVVDSAGRWIEANEGFDGSDHGTHVCGTIAGGKDPDGVSIGVAPEADLVVAAVLLGGATVASIISALEWAIVDQDADVVNMSFGMEYYEPRFSEVLRAFEYTYDFVPVVAIGNESHGNMSSPGSVYEAMSVGAVEKGRGRQVDVTSFSSGASLVFPQDPVPERQFVTKPDVVAPGEQVWSCVPPEDKNDRAGGYVYMAGTSMATPHVSGVVALLMAAKPSASSADIVQALKDTAWHPDGKAARPDNRWGFGLIDPMAALKALG